MFEQISSIHAGTYDNKYRKNVQNVMKHSINLMVITMMDCGFVRLSVLLTGIKFRACSSNGVIKIIRIINKWKKSNIEIGLYTMFLHFFNIFYN